MNNAKRNYPTIEKETLVMIYIVKKIRDYVLDNSFIFLIWGDHHH